jgi:hypothetical protein
MILGLIDVWLFGFVCVCLRVTANTALTRQDYTILDYTVVNLYASGKQIQEILREMAKRKRE